MFLEKQLAHFSQTIYSPDYTVQTPFVQSTIFGHFSISEKINVIFDKLVSTFRNC